MNHVYVRYNGYSVRSRKLGFFCLLFLPLVLLAFSDSPVRPLSYDEAYAIVGAEEAAKERDLDERYERVLNHPDNIASRTTYDSLGNEIIHISMHPGVLEPEKPKPKPKPIDPEVLAELMKQAGKPMINVTLSGEVDADGISEVWWTDKEGLKHRVFTNANFLYFTGFAQFENETNRFHTFLMITRRSPYVGSGDKWRPTLADFPSEGGIEYFPVEPDNVDSADYSTLEAMLAYYAEHSTDMKTTYENRKLLARARKDYLAANPPKKRPFIMNFREMLEPGDPRLRR